MIGRSHIVAALAAIVAVSTSHAAWAQQTTSNSGWTFSVAPYLWLPTVNTTLDYSLPRTTWWQGTHRSVFRPGRLYSEASLCDGVRAEAHYDAF